MTVQQVVDALKPWLVASAPFSGHELDDGRFFNAAVDGIRRHGQWEDEPFWRDAIERAVKTYGASGVSQRQIEDYSSKIAVIADMQEHCGVL